MPTEHLLNSKFRSKALNAKIQCYVGSSNTLQDIAINHVVA